MQCLISSKNLDWLASNNGDELFGSTSQALALATAKEGNEINTINLESRATTLESRATTLEGRATTLETQQFGIGQRWYNTSNVVDVNYINNTSKTIGVYVQTYDPHNKSALYIFIDNVQVHNNVINVGDSITAVTTLVPSLSIYKITSIDPTVNIKEFR